MTEIREDIINLIAGYVQGGLDEAGERRLAEWREDWATTFMVAIPLRIL